MKIQSIPPEIKESIRNNSLILFIGSGYSRNIGLPIWDKLVEQIVNKISEIDSSLVPEIEVQKSLKSTKNLKISPVEILEIIFKKGHSSLSKRILENIINIGLENSNLENQQLLWGITKKIITTNYDKALESSINITEDGINIFTHSSRHIGSSIIYLRDNEFLYKIHGTIDHAEECILFKDDYYRLYKLNHNYLTTLKGVCTNATLLFIGFSFNDFDINYLMRNVKKLFHNTTKHFILTPKSGGKQFKRQGVKIIPIDGYGAIAPFLRSLSEYRLHIDHTLSSIIIKTKDNYRINNKLDYWHLDRLVHEKKEQYLFRAGKEDILELEKFEYIDAESDSRIKSKFIKNGKEKQIKEYLQFKREAKRFETLSHFSNIEGGSFESSITFSIEYYLKALRKSKRIFSSEHPEVIVLYNHIASRYFSIKKMQQARYYYNKALKISLKIIPNAFITGSIYNNLGNIESKRKHYRKALQYYCKGQKIKENLGMDISSEIRNSNTMNLYLKNYKNTLEGIDQILKIKTPQVIFRANDYIVAGCVYKNLGRQQEAISYYQKSIRLYFKYYGLENEKFLMVYNDIGFLYSQCRKYKKSIFYYKKVIRLSSDSEEIFIANNNIGEAYLKLDNFKKAVETFKGSINLLKKSQIKESDCPEAYAYCRNQIDLFSDKNSKED